MDDSIYKNIFSKLKEPILILGSNGKIIDANHSLEVLLGYDEKILPGKDIDFILAGEADGSLIETFEGSEKQIGTKEEFTLRREDGTTFVRNIHIFSSKDDTGNTVYCFQIPVGIGQHSWLGDIFDLSESGQKDMYDDVMLALAGPTQAEPETHVEPQMSEALIPAPIPDEFKQPELHGAAEQKESERKIKSIISWGREGIISTDVYGNITEYNKAFLTMIGIPGSTEGIGPEKPTYTGKPDVTDGTMDIASTALSSEVKSISAPSESERIIGRSLRDFLAPGHESDMEPVFKKLRRDVSVVTIKTVLYNINRFEIPITLNATAMKDAGNKVLGFIMVMQRQKQKETEPGFTSPPERLRLAPHPIVKKVANLIKEGVVITNIVGIITGINSAMEGILGMESVDLQGQFTGKLFPEDERKRASSFIRTIESAGEALDQRFRLVVGGGSTISVLLDGSLIEDPDGGKVGMMLVVRVESDRDLKR